jgi:hypothetical protein
MGLLATIRPSAAAVIDVPDAVATIQAAVDVAGPGDTIRVAPGHYPESVRIDDGQTGLTIEPADPARPFTIQGARHKSADGVRVDDVDGITLRGFHVVGAYNAVRLNRVSGAVVSGLHVEDSALGIRVTGGHANAVIGCAVAGTRVEQGIRVDGSPDILLADNVTDDTDEQGIRVLDSPRATPRPQRRTRGAWKRRDCRDEVAGRPRHGLQLDRQLSRRLPHRAIAGSRVRAERGAPASERRHPCRTVLADRVGG